MAASPRVLSLIFMTIASLSPAMAQGGPALVGTVWTTGCLTRPDGPSGSMDLKFTDHTLTMEETQYADRGCTERNAVFATEHLYQLGDRRSDASTPGMSLDLKVTKVVITVLEAKNLSVYNEIAFCGRSDWRLNEPRDVSNLDCHSSLAQQGDATFTLMLVTGSGDSRALYLGELSEGHDASSPDKRPTRINMLTRYQQVPAH